MIHLILYNNKDFFLCKVSVKGIKLYTSVIRSDFLTLHYCKVNVALKY